MTACAAPECREFDFWLGSWEVRSPDGEIVGHNRITRVADGCGLREQWRGVRGLRGTSLNAWSADRVAWHQTWVDSSGTVLLLDGGLRNGSMVLEGQLPASGQPGGRVHHRISWSLVAGDHDRVRQLWETSADGTSWEIAFDGRYRRIGT
ncbi:MAG TPA: hypothetical protein VK838_04680 [Candidatus Limnocylindrales bacterium]|nr:hypothetical protein [Candidatus Limnocylindrales bacterium]